MVTETQRQRDRERRVGGREMAEDRREKEKR